MARLKDYANPVLLRRGPFTLYSPRWERRFNIFKDGRCVATASNRITAIHYTKGKY